MRATEDGPDCGPMRRFSALKSRRYRAFSTTPEFVAACTTPEAMTIVTRMVCLDAPPGSAPYKAVSGVVTEAGVLRLIVGLHQGDTAIASNGLCHAALHAYVRCFPVCRCLSWNNRLYTTAAYTEFCALADRILAPLLAEWRAAGRPPPWMF
jgi:hypothetical protein